MKGFKFAAAAAALLMSGFSAMADGGHQTADEAKARMDGLAAIFQKYGVGAFDMMNGHGFGGTHTERRGDKPESYELGEFLKSDDGRSPIICIVDGMYAVNQLQPMVVNTSAVEGSNIWRDGVGIAMVGKIVEAFKNQNPKEPKGVVTVKFIEGTKGVNENREARPEEEKFKLLAYSSEKLLGKRNESGKKFFCATRYVSFESTDESDNDRLAGPDKPDAKKHHKKKVAKKEEAKAEVKQTDAKKEEKKEEKKPEAKKA